MAQPAFAADWPSPAGGEAWLPRVANDAIAAAAVHFMTRHRWTEPDLAHLPAGNRYEIIDGRLHVTPPAGESHHDWCAWAYDALRAAAPVGWRIRWDLGLAFGDDRFIPDLVVLSPEIALADSDYNQVVPDLVVEVESRSTRAVDRVEKAEAYAAAGIAVYWLIERTGRMTVLELAADGTYHVSVEVKPGSTVRLERPYPVEVGVPGT